MASPLIYNLFPSLVGPMDRWLAHAHRAREMGFNWLFINPIQFPGFSGSLYAIKDHYRINPAFVPQGERDPLARLRQTIADLHRAGLRVALDLVANHTARDALLVDEHPDWYRRDEQGAVASPFAIDPADETKVTVWGDLAELDYDDPPDREALFDYWVAVTRHYLELGFDGYRCDAAYKVPAALWERLIGAARAHDPQVVFMAETLGCRLEEVRQLRDAGFDYLFNSSKWWDFDEPWLLEQHEELGAIAPSIGFPESHDTPRLMQESGGSLSAQKMRYAFAAFFAEGVLLPVGYEYGFVKRLDVVRTRPTDWEQPRCDLTGFITRINRLKQSRPTLASEGHFTLETSYDEPTIVLRKTADGDDPLLIAVNKDQRRARRCELPWRPPAAELLRVCRDEARPEPLRAATSIVLEPGDLVLVASPRRR